MPKQPMFAAPKREGSYPDRNLDCQMAIENAFRTMADCAVAAGWTEQEVTDALIELAHNHWFALDARDRMFEEAVGAVIRRAKPAAVH